MDSLRAVQLPEAFRWLWSEDSEAVPKVSQETKPPVGAACRCVAAGRRSARHGRVDATVGIQGFPNTVRDWAIYVPAQYDKGQPAAIMVFQDGERLRDVKGRWRVPVVFDNLIARGDMPPTIAVFIDPGNDKSKTNQPKGKPSNRSYEYDSLGDRYTRFLLEEIMPEVEQRYNISKDPAMRAIGGSSSGAICLHGGLGTSRCVPKGVFERRQLHQHPRRRRLFIVGS